jgi:hypothetical protein
MQSTTRCPTHRSMNVVHLTNHLIRRSYTTTSPAPSLSVRSVAASSRRSFCSASCPPALLPSLFEPEGPNASNVSSPSSDIIREEESGARPAVASCCRIDSRIYMTQSSCGEIRLTALMEPFQKTTWGANQVHRSKSETFPPKGLPESYPFPEIFSHDPGPARHTCVQGP